jgi:hypothetical protein
MGQQQHRPGLPGRKSGLSPGAGFDQQTDPVSAHQKIERETIQGCGDIPSAFLIPFSQGLSKRTLRWIKLYPAPCLPAFSFYLSPFTFRLFFCPPFTSSYSKYSFIRSKKLFSFLPGLGLKLGESCSFSSSSRSSRLRAFGVQMLMCTS